MELEARIHGSLYGEHAVERSRCEQPAPKAVRDHAHTELPAGPGTSSVTIITDTRHLPASRLAAASALSGIPDRRERARRHRSPREPTVPWRCSALYAARRRPVAEANRRREAENRRVGPIAAHGTARNRRARRGSERDLAPRAHPKRHHVTRCQTLPLRDAVWMRGLRISALPVPLPPRPLGTCLIASETILERYKFSLYCQ